MQSEIKKSLIHLIPENHHEITSLISYPPARYEREGRYSINRDRAIVKGLENILGYGFLSEEKVETRLQPKLKAGEHFTVNVDGLRDYQIVGSRFLLERGRCILADDTGLGKTRTAVHASKHRKTLVIAPLNKCQDWVDEINNPNTVRAFGTHKRKKWGNEQYVVTNYESVNKNRLGLLFSTKWEAIIIEEAHYLSNRSSQRTKAVAELVKLNPESMVWMLTATPVWNEPDAIWSLLNILDPIRFGSYWRFVESFCNIKETKFSREVFGVRADTLDIFKDIISDFLLRRLKSDVIDLPDRIEHIEWLDTPLALRKELRAMKKEMREDTGMVNLAQLRIHLLKNGIKQAAFKEILEKEKDKKILVFVKYRESASLALEWLNDVKLFGYINNVPITGDVTVPERRLMINEFREFNGPAALLGTTKCMGTGLDLQCASVVIFLEHPFLYSELDQCYGRIERIGTTENPTYYHLFHKGTVDEDVWKSCMSRSSTALGILNV